MFCLNHIRWLIGAGLIALIAFSAGADRVQTIATLSTRESAETAASWRGGNGSPAPLAVGDGLRFVCPSRLAADRAYWDCEISLDLRHFDILEIELACARPQAIRTIGIYLKSGAGWYLWLAPLKGAGRQKLFLPIRGAAVEGRPAGWKYISALRISVTRAAAESAGVDVYALRARRCDIVLVRGTASQSKTDERKMARSATLRLNRWLHELAIPHAILTDEDVMDDGLESARVAILPYNADPPERELKALTAFVERGGKLIVCYSASAELAQLLHLQLGQYQAAARPGQWSSFSFNRAAPDHVPPTVYQESSNIRPVYPAGQNARIIATWNDAAGRSLSHPAWVQSDRGFWMSHILMDGDDEAKKRLILALLGFYEPAVWQQTAMHTLWQAGRVGPYQNRAETLAGIRRLARGTSQADEVDHLLTQAERQYATLCAGWNQQNYPETVETGVALKATLLQAYARAQTPVSPEFRGVWNHTGTGLGPGTWPQTCRLLADSGFTAVLPNILWAGVAHYPSAVVPVSSTAQRYGDQIQQCTAAARRNNLEVHVWKICWNLGRAPDDWVRKLRRDGRLQVTDERRTLDWLCPSHPDNQALELNAIREIARQYPIDGIHLDYIRYPDAHACFCATCRRQFENWLGYRVWKWPAGAKPGGKYNAAYTTWRCAQITAFVRAVRDNLRQVNPRLKLSAAVYACYPDCKTAVGQDWGLWLKSGLVDFVCPMDYDSGNASFAGLVQQQLALPGAKGRVYPGLGVTAAESRLTPDQVIDQIQYVRASGGRGFVLFDLNRSLEKEALPALGLGATRRE